VKTARPDIMLLDIIMPGMDGFEVLERLRSFTQLPVIAFSANADNRSNAMLHGASDFMAKPFEPDEMARCIKGILDHSGNGKNQSR
jgi:two-component system KDP operon response regulator KdpE